MMEKIGLVIDSTTLTRDDLKAYKFIKVAQLKVQVNEDCFLESDLSKEEMQDYINKGKKLLTSQPAPTDFLDLYREFFDEGYTNVIVITLSHKLSGTYQSALLAKSMVDFKLEINVHSPETASFGVALGVKRIAEMIENGNSFSDIEKRYYILYKEPAVAFTLGDLMNLFHGGRLNRVQAFIGKILRIKPIIEMIEGKLELVKKERTNNACLKHFLDKIDYYVNNYKNVYLDIININMPDWAQKLLDSVHEKYKNIEVHMTDYVSPVFYSHLGNKGFGIAVLAE